MNFLQIIGHVIVGIFIGIGALFIHGSPTTQNQIVTPIPTNNQQTPLSTQTPTNQTNTQTPPVTQNSSFSCSQFSNLQSGDTDATTNGKVSQLQEFLGISPTTGLYGPKTQIGYTNKCVGGNTQPTSVAGMSMYTDSSFGFSFWYPNSWTVGIDNNPFSHWTPGGDVKVLVIKNTSGDVAYITEAYPPKGMAIEDLDKYTSEGYYFDSSSGAWMHAQLTNGQQTTAQPANVSVNTMGGLHVLSWVSGDGNVLVPLSATKFVNIFTLAGRVSMTPLINTIVATNPTVATPVTTAQQVSTIQAEAKAYSTNTTNSQIPPTTVTPVIQSLSTSSGSIGTSVTVYGSGFAADQSVLFGVLPITTAPIPGYLKEVFQYPITCAGTGGKLYPVGSQGYCSFSMQVSSDGTSLSFVIPTAMQADYVNSGGCALPECFPSYSQGEEGMPITPGTYGVVIFNPKTQKLSNIVNFTVTN